MNNDDTRRLTMDRETKGYHGSIYPGLRLRCSRDDVATTPWRTVDRQEGERVYYINDGGWDSESTLRRFRSAFDAPEPTAKPADRPLAPGWTRKDAFAYSCTYPTGGGMCCRKECVLRGPGGKGGCSDDHAGAQGAFADASKAEPRQDAATVKRAVDALAALVPKALPRCGKCSHAGHSGPCGGSSPNGEWGCPCGDLTAKDARDAARGAYAVGTYNGKSKTHEGSLVIRAEVKAYDVSTGATSVLLANLAREKPPVRELPKVRDIYRHDGPGCDRDNLPNREVG